MVILKIHHNCVGINDKTIHILVHYDHLVSGGILLHDIHRIRGDADDFFAVTPGVSDKDEFDDEENPSRRLIAVVIETT